MLPALCDRRGAHFWQRARTRSRLAGPPWPRAIEALRASGVDVRIDVDELPDVDDIDEKVLILAQRQRLRIATCSADLAHRASQRGVEALDLRHLTAELTPDHPPGEHMTIDLVREGRQSRQAIGYLPEGDMVVVNDAAHLIGAHDVDVVVTSTRQTTQGLLVFAHLAEHELHFDFEDPHPHHEDDPAPRRRDPSSRQTSPAGVRAVWTPRRRRLTVSEQGPRRPRSPRSTRDSSPAQDSFRRGRKRFRFEGGLS